MKRDLEWLGKATFSLEAFEVGDALTRGLNLDGERAYGCNDIEGVAKDTAAGESRIKLPDCRGRLNIGDFGDDGHDIGDRDIEDMG